MEIVGILSCFQIRDDSLRRSNLIREKRRLRREANTENKVAVDRAVDYTSRVVDKPYRQQVTEKANVSNFRQAF